MISRIKFEGPSLDSDLVEVSVDSVSKGTFLISPAEALLKTGSVYKRWRKGSLPALKSVVLYQKCCPISKLLVVGCAPLTERAGKCVNTRQPYTGRTFHLFNFTGHIHVLTNKSTTYLLSLTLVASKRIRQPVPINWNSSPGLSYLSLLALMKQYFQEGNHMEKLTYVLLVLVLGTVGFSLTRDRNLTTATAAGQEDAERKYREHNKKIKERFPTVDYNKLDPPDPEKKAKKKRYNDGNWVYSNVGPDINEAILTPEPHVTFPPLPVGESDIVVVGTIGSGEAHLSDNKKNIFSEFTLIVEEVLKSKMSGIGQGSVLTADRIGGHVIYPNGQKFLYRVFGVNMPQVGSRYLLFLTAKHNKEDLSILTAYELAEAGAVPLDEQLPETAALKGVREKDILQSVRGLIANSK